MPSLGATYLSSEETSSNALCKVSKKIIIGAYPCIYGFLKVPTENSKALWYRVFPDINNVESDETQTRDLRSDREE